jgi:hypothetical protein
VSRLPNYHPQRVSACVFLGSCYIPPLPAGGDRVSQHAQIKETFDYDVYAYMRFFVQPDAPAIIEKHVRTKYLHFKFQKSDLQLDR